MIFPIPLLPITASLVGAVIGGYFPPSPQGVKVVESKHHEGVKISYKEPGICETTPGVKSYSGYVHLPPGTLNDVHLDQPYPINTFFWFFEARDNPKSAPLSIWLNGGPGSSSLMGLLQEHGPCRVNPDSNSTELNSWSWNNHVNMLYIDQPVQVGFSFDVLKNGTLNQLTQSWDVSPFEGAMPECNNTFRLGTFPSMNSIKTANTTEDAARALWHFSQTWFTEFPEYKPLNDREQNEKISRLSSGNGSAHYIHLDTLGIINGCIDQLVQAPAFPKMAHDNTYGIQAINSTISNLALNNYYKPGGCEDQIHLCRHLAADGDPNMYGNNDTVNSACSQANTYCRYQVEAAYYNYSTRSSYDISHQYPDPFPPPFYMGFLNQGWVQSALGVPLNYSFAAASSYSAFRSTGDYPRQDTRGYLGDIGQLLDLGIKVALVYGDRDYACNWYGGEEVSLQVPYSQVSRFLGASYAALHTNNTYVGGLVRQHGNFSFTRVFQAGHEVPAYQPETAYRIFERVMFNRDIATGNVSTVGEYTSYGLGSIWDVMEKPPTSPPPVCYLLDLEDTCADEQIRGVINGTAVVRDYIVMDKNSEGLFE